MYFTPSVWVDANVEWALLRVLNLSVSVRFQHETSRGLEGELPYIKDGDRVVPYRNICKYLEQLV